MLLLSTCAIACEFKNVTKCFIVNKAEEEERNEIHNLWMDTHLVVGIQKLDTDSHICTCAHIYTHKLRVNLVVF